MSRHRAKRDESTVRDCSDPDDPYLPPTATDTTERIADLRVEMEKIVPKVNGRIAAYLIPSADAHNSEYIAECHERRQWITGFTGSAGFAIVTMNQSAVWTDGRYFLQAEQQLDCNWILMKQGEPETPLQWEWLIDVLPPGTEDLPTLVAFDPTLISISLYNTYDTAFKAARADDVYIEMYSHQENLVDIIWDDQPECPNEPLYIMDIKWAGQEWFDKVTDHRKEMGAVEANMMVLHALDDTAWFFNLRGEDIPYNPVFFAYTIIELEKTTDVGVWSPGVNNIGFIEPILCDSVSKGVSVQPVAGVRSEGILGGIGGCVGDSGVSSSSR
uniref:Xaa-Pro aminopeptidase 2-like n=1 Tax=Saccoglossus kowalevskii TaxID=10224 RepID=A0ABM0MWU6_SACKO|nr:PREDICTED: xaa-Pro aminopeptidase 2-like [Saccoglossus kowalevskii]